MNLTLDRKDVTHDLRGHTLPVGSPDQPLGRIRNPDISTSLIDLAALWILEIPGSHFLFIVTLGIA